jgi:hypothetical protein
MYDDDSCSTTEVQRFTPQLCVLCCPVCLSPPQLSYGDEQHLDEALDKIFRFGKGGGVPRKNAPKLFGALRAVVWW